MYIPEYTITNKILQSISIIEHLKAITETQIILPSWEKKLQKDAKVDFFKDNLKILGITPNTEEIKKYLDGLVENPGELIQNINSALEKVTILAQTSDMDEENLRQVYQIIMGGIDTLEESTLKTKDTLLYRRQKVKGKVSPEEILAEMVGLFDWLNSLDGKETHPLIKAAIVRARIIGLMPFQNYNELMGNLMAHYVLKEGKYNFKGFYHLETAYTKDLLGYQKAQDTIVTFSEETPELTQEEDLTPWINFYLGTMASEAATKKEEIMLMSRDTKIATSTGRANLTKRQEKIVRYLHDYGLIQNKDFEKVFPKISEDTVLRDLKKLIKKDIIEKKGRTKASRYVLK